MKNTDTDWPKFLQSKMKFAREKAAQAWCAGTTRNKEMDVDLAEEFAKILVEEMYSPHLGCATTKELLDEIQTRIMHHSEIYYYRTID